MKQARAELVRIDGGGIAKPVGNVAFARMKAREGAYRVLPAPGHIVFMRFTGEDGRRDAEDGAIVRLAGEITAPGTMCDVIALLGQSGWKGELVVLDGESARSIFFDKGNLVGAQTSVGDERIGMILWRFGVIDEAQHEAIVEKLGEGKRFGQIGVELGFFTQDKLFEYIARQLEEIVFPTFAISDGTYFFLDGFDDARLVARHAMSATALLMDGLTRFDELKFFRQRIPSSEFVPARTEKGDPPSDYAQTYAAIDGKTSIEELGRITGGGEFQTTKDVYALLSSRHVELHPPRMAGGAAAVIARANAALSLIHQRADGGGKGTVLRESLAEFLSKSESCAVLLGSGPDERGTFDPETAVSSAVGAAGDDGAEQALKQCLFEYVAFALFSAGGALGAAIESSIAEDVRPMLEEIMPTG
jgi:hypothetical protein